MTIASRALALTGSRNDRSACSSPRPAVEGVGCLPRVLLGAEAITTRVQIGDSRDAQYWGVRFGRSAYAGGMAGAIAHDKAQRLRSALDGILRTQDGDALGVPESAREAFLRLVDVLESSAEAVVLPSDALLSTQQAAELLGVSRMTVVRLVDRGELVAEGGGVHRRIAATELARYRAASAARRRAALHDLAQEIGDDAPPDKVISTR